jgi:hypothetical protein
VPADIENANGVLPKAGVRVEGGSCEIVMQGP